MNMLMNLRIPQTAEIFIDSRGTVKLGGNVTHHAVRCCSLEYTVVISFFNSLVVPDASDNSPLANHKTKSHNVAVIVMFPEFLTHLQLTDVRLLQFSLRY